MLCLSCSSRLEVIAQMAGESAKCPTCGSRFTVPPLNELVAGRDRLIEVGTVSTDPMPVHAYAAAGGLAPQIVADDSGQSAIRCSRCGKTSAIDSERCQSCGTPFTVEATTQAYERRVASWFVASVLLGIASVLLACSPVVAVAAIVCSIVAVRHLGPQPTTSLRVAAWSGMVLGGISLLLFLIVVVRQL